MIKWFATSQDEDKFETYAFPQSYDVRQRCPYRGSLCHLYRNVHHVFDTMLNAYAYSVYICTLYMYNVNTKMSFLINNQYIYIVTIC